MITTLKEIPNVDGRTVKANRTLKRQELILSCKGVYLYTRFHGCRGLKYGLTPNKCDATVYNTLQDAQRWRCRAEQVIPRAFEVERL